MRIIIYICIYSEREVVNVIVVHGQSSVMQLNYYSVVIHSCMQNEFCDVFLLTGHTR